MYVLGTAGHIDHGKSVLVKALTGIDPDRLREEKERGMTIDLGFAWLKLPSGREVGIVDVPGHERFVKNMLAGVGGIDLALLIIAANEGAMPQTKEHLAILDLLQVHKGIVVLTKKDLVDEELLSLVRMEAEELIAPTSLAGAPIVAVSALTGEALPLLIDAIDRLLATTEPRKDTGKPRLFIDRVFTIAGAGTVVTGTLIDGSLSLGQELEVVPSGLRSRVRGLQTHKARVETASPGSRVAVNLVGIATTALKRGDVLTRPGWLEPAGILTVKLRLLTHLARPLRHNAPVSFHSGSAETMAKVRLLEADLLEPGGETWAQVVLRDPVAVLSGDRFIVRSPMETLGGGSIVETQPRRLRRYRPGTIERLEARKTGSAEQSVIALLETRPLELASLVKESSVPEEEVRKTVNLLLDRQELVAAGQGEQAMLFTATGWQELQQKAIDIVREYHRKFPTRTGMPKLELAARLHIGNHGSDVIKRLIEQGALAEEGAAVRLPEFGVRLTQAQQAKIDTFLRSLKQNPYSPPSDLIPEHDLLSLLVEQGKVIKVSDGIVYDAAIYREMVEKVRARIKSEGKVSLAGVRDMFGTSRKYAQAFMEHLDGERVTRRVGDERVLY